MIKAISVIQTSDQNDHLFKIVVLGELHVGKTSWIQRFMDDTFSPNLGVTVGCAYTPKSISILGKIIILGIWDIWGHERFRDTARIYYRGSKGAIFMYDISSRDTFNELQYWLNDFRSSILTQTVSLLIGNKTDLTTERQVSFDEGQRFAEKNQMLFFECSAKTGENVDRAFTEIGINIYHQQNIKVVSSKNEINNDQNKITSFLNWFNGSKNAKPKTNSKEVNEEKAIVVGKDQKIEEKIINDDKDIDETML